MPKVPLAKLERHLYGAADILRLRMDALLTQKNDMGIQASIRIAACTLNSFSKNLLSQKGIGDYQN